MKTNKQPKITLVGVEEGDWIGLYIDGKLVRDGHSIDERMMLEFLSAEFDFTYEVGTADQEWLEENISFPNLLKDMKVIK